MSRLAALVSIFAQNFTHSPDKPRWVGMEGEFPVVSSSGEAVAYPVISQMYALLEQQGFALKKDADSGKIVYAERAGDIICTDLGYSTIEIAPAPAKDLFALNRSLTSLLRPLSQYFAEHDALILGYGIQPLSPPHRRLITPKSRYLFFKDWSANRFVSPEHGHDSDFLGITASSQTHVDVSRAEAVRVVNVLNGLAGLFIILHANSPIWQGNVDGRSGAMRELLWGQCFPNREEQIGMAAQFIDIKDYVRQLCAFKMQTVERNGQSLALPVTGSFFDFLAAESVDSRSVSGESRTLVPASEDIVNQAGYAWFNGRLAPKFGTVEARVCCQQPPGESLCSQALVLGLIENLTAAERLLNRFSWQDWRLLRTDALNQGFAARMQGESVLPLLAELLEIAANGLHERAVGEETFLKPLRERLAARRSPADRAVLLFQQNGLLGLLNSLSLS